MRAVEVGGKADGHLDVDGGMHRREGAQYLRQQARQRKILRSAEAHPAAQFGVCEIAFCARMRGENFAREFGQRLPIDGQRDAVGVAIEEATARRRLEPAHVLAHRRLAQIPTARRFREGAALDDGEEGDEQIRVVSGGHHNS